MKKIDCYIDGACEPKNPGGTGSYGIYALEVESGVPTEDWGVCGSGESMTNNVAEYTALRKALVLVKEKWGTDLKLTIYGDSQLVINQMSGEWNTDRASGKYVQEMTACLQLLTQFPRIEFIWIPREQNTFADGLSKRALAEKGIKPRVYQR
jgi:ribonuclease HI